jgi:hypothetical protein
MSFTSRDKKEFPIDRRGNGEAHNTGKGIAGWKQGVPAVVPHDRMGVRHATKKPSTNGQRALETNARLDMRRTRQTLMRLATPLPWKKSLGRKLCVPAFQSGMPLKTTF